MIFRSLFVNREEKHIKFDTAQWFVIWESMHLQAVIHMTYIIIQHVTAVKFIDCKSIYPTGLLSHHTYCLNLSLQPFSQDNNLVSFTAYV